VTEQLEGTDDSLPDGDTELIELVVGKPAAGGGCVARLADGRVAFVRHCIPGERVLARITAEARSFVRADAVEVLEASPSRVVPPCRHAGPGRCGGCDWQHVSTPMQREMKASLIAEQLERLAGVSWPVVVEQLSGDEDGLGWRTRVRFAALPKGRLGFYRHRSHDVEPVTRCLITSKGVQRITPERLKWRGATEVEVFAPEPDGELAVAVATRKGTRFEPPRFDGGLVVDGRCRREPCELEIPVLGRRFTVSSGVFWQVHAGAPPVLATAVVEMAAPLEGEAVADLYSGVGLFSALLASAVGETGHVLAVEQSDQAARDAVRNLGDTPNTEVLCDSVTPELVARELRRTSLVVLDPPREGAGKTVMAALAGLRRLRRVVYVACDPASFARDLRVLLDSGWALAELRAFDMFPMTSQVEVMAAIDPPRV
jgi:tRNA/tmRNA/rRNA uracil-C5-methylase (TrmA/RlmC/RlmD family)